MLKTETTFLYRSDTLYDFVPFKAVNSVILCVFPFIAFTWQIKTFGSRLRGLGARINSSPNLSAVAGRFSPSQCVGGRRPLALEAKGEPPWCTSPRGGAGEAPLQGMVRCRMAKGVLVQSSLPPCISSGGWTGRLCSYSTFWLCLSPQHRVPLLTVRKNRMIKVLLSSLSLCFLPSRFLSSQERVT